MRKISLIGLGKPILYTTIILAVIASSWLFGFWYRDQYLPRRTWAEAKMMIEMNLTMEGLAAVEPYYQDLASSDESCTILIKAYKRVGSLQRMAYFAESCMAKGYKPPAVYLGMATFLEAQGNIGDALAVLMPQASLLAESWEIPHEVFRLLEKKHGINEDAIKYLILAQTRATADNHIARDPLEELIVAKKWDLAYQLVEGISNHPGATQNDKFRAMVSLVYRQHGDFGQVKRFERVRPTEGRQHQ